MALLRAETGPQPAWPAAEAAAVGALAWAVGRGAHGPLAGFGVVGEAGPAWTSAAGGRIDARIRLQFLLPPAIEGGAAIDAEGRLLGLAVADPRRRALVIPAATVGARRSRRSPSAATSAAATSGSRCSRCAAAPAG